MPKKKIVGQNAVKESLPAKKARATTPAVASKKASAGLSIDYPLEGEIVTAPAYTFRLTAAEPRSVEVSLDGKQWLSCRESVGHWWFDWSGTQSGAYTLRARMKSAAGRTVSAQDRRFTVLI